MNSLWLFKYLFQHEMVKTAFLNGCQFHIQLGDIRGLSFITQILQDQLIWFNNSYFVIIYIHNFFSVFNDRRSIRGKKVFTFTNTNYKWASFPRCNQCIWIILVNKYNY